MGHLCCFPLNGVHERGTLPWQKCAMLVTQDGKTFPYNAVSNSQIDHEETPQDESGAEKGLVTGS